MPWRRLLTPLTSRTTWLRWAFLVLGGAALVPYVLATASLLSTYPGASPDTPAEIAGGVGFLLAGVALVGVTALIPAVRTLELTAVRELLGVRLPVTLARTGADRLRTVLFYGAHLLVGGLVSGLSLSLPAGASQFVRAPFGRTEFGPALGWAGAWLPAVGVAMVVALVYLTALAGWLLARLAPVLLGPSAADRLAALRREADRLAERNRLARELHDSVGHTLNVVTLQAAAARTVLDANPEFARKALLAIEESARTALTDLDHALGVLRADTDRPGADRPGTEVQPSLAGLDRLVATSGADVDLTVAGELASVPGTTSRAAYRIVQEGLTNALRHAGRVPVTVRLTVQSGWLTVLVTNPRGSGLAGGGRGLAGIRERVTLLRGEMTAGPVDGEWHLSVRLPV